MNINQPVVWKKFLNTNSVNNLKCWGLSFNCTITYYINTAEPLSHHFYGLRVIFVEESFARREEPSRNASVSYWLLRKIKFLICRLQP